MSEAIHTVCPSCHAINRVPSDKLSDAGNCGKCHKPLFPGEPVNLSTGNFARYIEKNELPVVVDFWASWCGPCKMMAPVFAQAAAQLRGQVQLAKLETEQAQQIAMQYNIRSIPTLVIFKSGREVNRVAGAMDQANLLNWINQYKS